MRIGIPRESRRWDQVAATRPLVEAAEKLGFEVAIRGSVPGLQASFDDAAFEAAGASVDTERPAKPTLSSVNAPTGPKSHRLRMVATLVSFIWPPRTPFGQRSFPSLYQCDGDGHGAMDLPCPVPRHPLFGQHRWLSRRRDAHQFGQLLHQNHRRRKVPPARCWSSVPVWVWTPSGPPVSLGAIMRAADTRLEVAGQIESMGGNSAGLRRRRWRFQRRLHQGDERREFIKAEMELVRPAGQGSGHHHAPP